MSEVIEQEGFNYDWYNLVNQYSEQYNGNEDNVAEFIDGLVPIYHNDIWEVAQSLNLGHLLVTEVPLHPEMTVYTLLQGLITQQYYMKFTEALIDIGIPELQ